MNVKLILDFFIRGTYDYFFQSTRKRIQ